MLRILHIIMYNTLNRLDFKKHFIHGHISFTCYYLYFIHFIYLFHFMHSHISVTLQLIQTVFSTHDASNISTLTSFENNLYYSIF